MRLNTNLLIYCELMLGIVLYVVYMKVEKDFEEEAAKIKASPDYKLESLKERLIESSNEMKNMTEY
jgi:hypothetical protein